MPKRPCLRRGCRELTATGSYCPSHTPPAWARRSPSSRATARPGWNAVRAQALQRDGHACTRCGSTIDLAVHHVVAVADGGTNTLGNLATYCPACHARAHGHTRPFSGPPAA